MIGTLDGPRDGRSTDPAGRTAGGFAASRSMKPFGAASAAPRRCCLTTAKPGAGNDEVRTDLQQLLLIFYSASERGDHQGNTMIPYLGKLSSDVALDRKF